MGKAKIIHDDSWMSSLSNVLSGFLYDFTSDGNYNLGKLKHSDVVVDGKHYKVMSKLLVSGRMFECFRLTLEDDSENDTELVLRRMTELFKRQHPECSGLLAHEYELYKEMNLSHNDGLIDIVDYIPEEEVVLSKLVPGLSLDRFVEQNPEYYFKRRTTIKMLKQLIKTVDFLHKKGLCHFNISPENILVKMTEEHDIMLLNIGLAAAYNKGVRFAPFLTNGLPPEMTNAEPLDKQTDIFEIGQIIKYIINVRKKDPTRASNHLKMIAMKCTKRKREERYSNVREILKDIEVWEHKYDNFFDGK